MFVMFREAAWEKRNINVRNTVNTRLRQLKSGFACNHKKET
jgi:hypothetical protein